MGTVQINGRTYTGNNVSIINGKVIIDGIVQQDDSSISKAVEVRILSGIIENIHTDKSVTCDDVKGDVNAGGSVSCDNVFGDVKAGGSVSCDDIGGSVIANGSISRS